MYVYWFLQNDFLYIVDVRHIYINALIKTYNQLPPYRERPIPQPASPVRLRPSQATVVYLQIRLPIYGFDISC